MNIIITGASRGIGAAMTRLFVKNGDHQIFILSRNKKELQELAAECSKLNYKATIIPIITDFVSSSEIENSVKQILNLVASIDILINNAGLAIRKPYEEISSKESDRMMKVNFYAPAILIKLLLPALVNAGNSHVVNIGSMAGFQGSSKFPGLTYYGATKAALANLTEVLATEYKRGEVSFNCLALGAVQTEMFSEVFPEFKARLKPDEIAEFIVNFALTAHKYMNGRIIPVSLAQP